MLSGFIITYVHFDDIGITERLQHYAWRRFTRVYPNYWSVTLIYVGLALVSPDSAERLSLLNVLESLTLLPLGHMPLIPVAWTLEREVIFYLVFGLVIWSRKLAWPLIAVGLAPMASGLFRAPGFGLADLVLSPFNVQFLMGIGAARLVVNGAVPCPIIIAGFGVTVFVVTAILDVNGVVAVNQLMTAMLYGSGSALMVGGIAATERAGLLRLGSWAELVGGASYALYLVHPAVVGIVARLLAMADILRSLPAWIVVAVQAGVSVAIALMIHRGLELPIMRCIRRRTALLFP